MWSNPSEIMGVEYEAFILHYATLQCVDLPN